MTTVTARSDLTRVLNERFGPARVRQWLSDPEIGTIIGSLTEMLESGRDGVSSKSEGITRDKLRRANHLFGILYDMGFLFEVDRDMVIIHGEGETADETIDMLLYLVEPVGISRRDMSILCDNPVRVSFPIT